MTANPSFSFEFAAQPHVAGRLLTQCKGSKVELEAGKVWAGKLLKTTLHASVLIFGFQPGWIQHMGCWSTH